MDIVIIQDRGTDAGGMNRVHSELYRIPGKDGVDHRQVSAFCLSGGGGRFLDSVFSVYPWALGGPGNDPEIRVTLRNSWLVTACGVGYPSEDAARKASEELACALSEEFGTAKPVSPKCEYCGDSNDTVGFRPDPYDADVNGDYSEHWICDECYDRSADEI